MKYELTERRESILLSVEATFTLIDFLLLFASFLLGFVFALFFLIFFGAVFLKLFTRHEFEFSSDEYQVTQYYRIFSYFRFRQRVLPFGEVLKVLLSNYESGEALLGRGMRKREWFTLDIMTGSKPMRIIKAEPDELDEINELYLELKDLMDQWFTFDVELVDFHES